MWANKFWQGMLGVQILSGLHLTLQVKEVLHFMDDIVDWERRSYFEDTLQ